MLLHLRDTLPTSKRAHVSVAQCKDFIFAPSSSLSVSTWCCALTNYPAFRTDSRILSKYSKILFAPRAQGCVLTAAGGKGRREKEQRIESCSVQGQDSTVLNVMSWRARLEMVDVKIPDEPTTASENKNAC